MEIIAKEKVFEGIAQSRSRKEVSDCARISQSRFLDELPGAAFAAVTLVWIIASFAHLIW
jgi:hypothetical protein